MAKRKNRKLTRAARERQARTGESYQLALHRVRGQPRTEPDPGAVAQQPFGPSQPAVPRPVRRRTGSLNNGGFGFLATGADVGRMVDSVVGKSGLTSIQTMNADVLRMVDGVVGVIGKSALESIQTMNADVLRMVDGVVGRSALASIQTTSSDLLRMVDGGVGTSALASIERMNSDLLRMVGGLVAEADSDPRPEDDSP